MSTCTKPPKMRSKIENDFDRITISIPGKKNIFIILFFSFWMFAFLKVEVLFLGKLVNGEEPIFVNLMISVFWTVGGIFAVSIFLWMIIGEEKITISNQFVSIERNFVSLIKPKRYMAENVKNFRVSLEDVTYLKQFGNIGKLNRGKKGLIAFDYWNKTIKFGTSIDEAEANIILASIKSRFRHLVKK